MRGVTPDGDGRRLRAFPRLSCGRPSRLVFPDMEEVGQLVDISQGGGKFMPFQLEVLATWGMPPGLPIKVEVGGLLIAATIAWATPNYSAIGCRFDDPLAPERLAAALALPLPMAAE
jgi:hypothetical protein